MSNEQEFSNVSFSCIARNRLAHQYIHLTSIWPSINLLKQHTLRMLWSACRYVPFYDDWHIPNLHLQTWCTGASPCIMWWNQAARTDPWHWTPGWLLYKSICLPWSTISKTWRCAFQCNCRIAIFQIDSKLIVDCITPLENHLAL